MKLKRQSFAIFVACLLWMSKHAHHADSHQNDEWTKHDSRRISHDKQAPLCPYSPAIYSWTFPDIFHSFPPAAFNMIFTFLFSFFSVGLKYLRYLKLYGDWRPNRKDRKNIIRKMEGQLIIQTDSSDSPVRTIITTTSYNPSQQMPTTLHAVTVASNNSVQRNLNENGKTRICRDFLRGSCRRLYCKYPHVQSNDMIVFCHDFQNNKCPRINCK